VSASIRVTCGNANPVHGTGTAIPCWTSPFHRLGAVRAGFHGGHFQSQIMADHLQDELRPPNVIGVNNGPFTSLAVPKNPGWRTPATQL